MIVYTRLNINRFPVIGKSNITGLPTFADMKSAILLSMLLVCVSAKAQFHTVTKRLLAYRIDIPKSLPEMGKVSDKEFVATAGKLPATKRNEWIQRYMSVSYPLKHVVVTSRYGVRTDPFSKKRKRHNGIDLRARNEEAYAMLSGVVVKAGQDKRSGKFVTLRHGDYTVSYCHLSQVLVHQGDSVRPGEVIAVTGNTGRSTAPHLHLTCRYRGRCINPDILLQFVQETKAEAVAQLGVS